MKLKRISLSIFVLCFLGFICWLFVIASKPEALTLGALLPEIKYESNIGTNQLKADGNKATMIVLFHPRCKHCIYQLDKFEKSNEILLNYNVFLFTTDKSFFTSGLIKRYKKLADMKSIKWGIVDDKQVKLHLGSTVSPQIFIFNSANKFVAKIRGESKIEYVLKKLDGPEHRDSGAN